jgi:hypothetical protein
VKSLQAANDNIIGRTRAIWEPRLGRDLAADQAREIAGNVAGFFALLAAWSRAELAAPANDNGDLVSDARKEKAP